MISFDGCECGAPLVRMERPTPRPTCTEGWLQVLAGAGVATDGALKKLGSMIVNEPVVIIGAGGLGLMALALLKAMGGVGAIVVDIDAAKRKAATAAGAIATVDGAAADAHKQIIK